MFALEDSHFAFSKCDIYNKTMELKRDYHTRLKDEQKLAEIARANPELARPETRINYTPDFYPVIGIDHTFDVLEKGFIRLFWSDFIVEEITSDGQIISINTLEETHPVEQNEEKPKTEADLVKQGTTTLEAIERLAETLNLPAANINYAGLKDAGAVTSQEISFNGLKPEQLQNLTIPNLFLKNIHERKGVVEMGNLYGNRFTILVRSPKVDLERLKDKVTKINQNGFYNFYSLQRFGPRLLTHKYGELILKGKYQEAAKLFLTGDSSHEINCLRQIRREAAQFWGNWVKMTEIFSAFPYFFYYELKALESLQETSIGFVKALANIKDQTRIFVYAYFSYWFNKLLSKKIQENAVPDELPLLRDNPEIKKIYSEVMSIEEIDSISYLHRGLEFLNLGKNQTIKTKIIPQIWHVYETPAGYIFHFDLGKGAYATSLLAEFFYLYQGKPAPEWVNQNETETRLSLGYAPIKETLEKFPPTEESVVSNLVE